MKFVKACVNYWCECFFNISHHLEKHNCLLSLRQKSKDLKFQLFNLIALNTYSDHFQKIAEGTSEKLNGKAVRTFTNKNKMSGLFHKNTLQIFFTTMLVVPSVSGKVVEGKKWLGKI